MYSLLFTLCTNTSLYLGMPILHFCLRGTNTRASFSPLCVSIVNYQAESYFSYKNVFSSHRGEAEKTFSSFGTISGLIRAILAALDIGKLFHTPIFLFNYWNNIVFLQLHDIAWNVNTQISKLFTFKSSHPTSHHLIGAGWIFPSLLLDQNSFQNLQI